MPNYLLSLVSILMTATLVNAQVTYDAEFWEGFEEDTQPYEHNWLDVPDFINMTEVEWYFNMTHNFLLGIERGIYNNETIVLDNDCFGPRFIIKINEFAAMTKSTPKDNWVLMIMIMYQLWYMWTEKCSIDKTFNDIYLYCWNDGCSPEKIGKHIERNILYMTRDLIDCGIVWWEGVPEHMSVNIEQWMRLSRETGKTMAGLVKETTNFTPQKHFRVKDIIEAPSEVDNSAAKSGG